MELSRVELVNQNKQQFLNYLNVGKEVAKKIGSPEHTMELYDLEYLYDISLRKYQKVLAHYKYSRKLKDSISSAEKSAQYVQTCIMNLDHYINGLKSHLEGQKRIFSVLRQQDFSQILGGALLVFILALLGLFLWYKSGIKKDGEKNNVCRRWSVLKLFITME